jgi:cytochrome c-type biogenesis protein CcmF
MADLGRAALVVTLGLALYATIAGAFAAHAGKRRLADSAGNALLASLGSTAVAAAVLLSALVRHDFSFAYVAQHTSTALSTGYSMSAFWGGQEGSLLLWLLLLTAYAAVAVAVNRRRAPDLAAWSVPVLGVVSGFFAFLLVAVSSPFETQARVAEGAGLNPSLQNPYMLAHPPLLYLGYVGLTVPFAFAMGALLSGRADERWIVATRRWTLVAWTALGIGQLLGSHWAYVEVGWGGYFAWDPVENAALMPWLAATAFLHSVMIQEKRGMLKVWNVLLVVLSFTLALFGTFLTRSGVVNSIHSFTQSPIGAWFLGFICFVVVASLVLIFWRLPLLRSKTRLESLVSREATFLYNNLLLVAFCLTILWGVAFPMLSELVRGESRTLGRPYYDFFLRAFGLPLLLLMGIGPLIAWRRASLRSVARTFLWPAVFALAMGVVLVFLGSGSSTPGLIAYTFSAFVLASITLEFVRGTRAAGSFTQLVSRNRRRYGGYVVHAAIVLLALGIAGSSAYGSETERKLSPGQSLEVGGYTFAYRGLAQTREPNHVAVRARMDVYRGGDRVATIFPGKNRYFAEQQVSNEMAIHTNWLRAEDVDVIADQINGDGSIYFKALVKPLVNLIWLAGLVFLAGSLVALWPDPREARRLASRYALAKA